MDGPGFTYDYFISRRGSFSALAQEAADVLEAAGYKVRLQDYDFEASGQFVADIDDALQKARHLLILYTADYQISYWTRQEFHNFLAAVAVGNGQRRIGILRCDAALPAGLMQGIIFGDLVGVDDPALRRDIILAVAEGRTVAARPVARVFGGPMPLENRLFTGRGELLTRLHEALSAPDGRAALTQAAVHGLGGVGKTSLARAYIALHGDDYDIVWWVLAADRAGVLAGLAELARALDRALPADTPTEQAANFALREIERRQGRTLLVYDNAPGPAAMMGLLPARGACVLVTSRNPDWDTHAAALPVATLPEEEAAALLQRRAGRTDEPGARRLAGELGCLPLALDQAGAYAKATRVSFDDYTRRVENLIHRPNLNADYPSSVAASFEIAIDLAGAAAEALLSLLAWYAPDQIPLRLLDGSMPEADRDEAFAALSTVSLVTAGPETEEDRTVSVHRLVQAVVRARLVGKGEDAERRDRALARLADAFPYGLNDPSVWPLCRWLLPHQRALVARLPPNHDSEDLARLLKLAGGFLLGSGDASAALPLFRRALEGCERAFGAEHPATLISVNNLAHCLQALGDASAALPLFRRALESCERVLGVEHPDALTGLNNLAGCLDTLGDASAALPLYRRALKGCERVLGAEHRDTLASVNNLAFCLQALDDASAALPLFRRALEGCQRVLGAEHPDTLTSLNNLAFCLQALGDASAALTLFRRALEGSERVLGAEHPDTLTSVNNLAGCLETLGDASAALPLYRRALEGSESVRAAEHPDTLLSVNNLAFCLQALGDASAALTLYRRALESQERVLGAEHPDTLKSMNNLAGCLETLGDASAALPLYRRAAEGCERVLGAEHPTTRTIRANYETALREADKTGGQDTE